MTWLQGMFGGGEMTIEELVREQVQEMDMSEIVRQEIRKIIERDVSPEIKKSIGANVAEYVKAEIEMIFQKGVKTDDGWGSKTTYSTFEELFKQTFKKAISSNYEIQRIIENSVKARMDEFLKTKSKDIAAALLRQLEGTP